MKKSRVIERIREKAGIAKLNEMQERVLGHVNESGDMVLYSPTGTGKTIAYATWLLTTISEALTGVQAVVMVPTRELARQVGEVLRTIAEGHKVLACYGGHSVQDEVNSLAGGPSIIVATPGRLVDLTKRGLLKLDTCRVLVIDEMDKILELGFEDDMHRIVAMTRGAEHKIVTSATKMEQLPGYLKLRNTLVIDYSERKAEVDKRMSVRIVRLNGKDKREALKQALLSIVEGRVIVFVNQRETVAEMCNYLRRHGIEAAGYHGKMEQIDREKAVAMLDNGSVEVLVATDVAARGLDVADVTHIVHYELPVSEDAYTHRNGRTARVDSSGEVVVLADEEPPEWVRGKRCALPDRTERESVCGRMATLYVNEGRKEKLSRGDIVGWIANCGATGMGAADIGKIVVNDHYALVAVPREAVAALVAALNATKVKGRRVRVSRAEAPSG